MAPSPNEAVWSTCSDAQLQDKISAMDAAGTNCLANVVTPDAITPVGQQFTDEVIAQFFRN